MRDLKWPVGATSYILETLGIPVYYMRKPVHTEWCKINNIRSENSLHNCSMLQKNNAILQPIMASNFYTSL